jgi:UPF0716 family protein affecting phage T7 exclusion
MGIFEKNWTPEQADEWTVHDLIACVLSVVSYVLVAVGSAAALLLLVWGFVALAIGIICMVLMYRVIDPKLRAMSKAFAKRQQQYLEQVDKAVRWEK